MSANDVGDKMEDKEDDQEDIQWFEAYDKMDQIDEHLKPEDILNYIKDVERNCRLEMNSGDETSADVCAKKSSKYSVKCPAARVRSSKAIKCKLTSRKNKSAARKVKLPHDATDARANADPKEKELHTCAPAESALQYPRSYGIRYREPSSQFYSRHRVSTTKLEIVADHPETMVAGDYRAIDDSRMDAERKARFHAFKKMTDKLREPIYTTAYSNIAPSSDKAKCDKCAEGDLRRGKLASKFNDQGFVEQRRLNRLYLNGTAQRHPLYRQSPWRNEREREGRSYAYGYRYPLPRNSTQPASWGRNLRSNRLAMSRLAKLSLQRRALREHEVQLRETIADARSIDRSDLECQWQHEDKTNQRYRERALRGEGRALLSLPKKSNGLYEVAYGESKLPLHCYCKEGHGHDEGHGETVECYAHYRCPEFRPRGRARQPTSYKEHEGRKLTKERRKDTATYDDEISVCVDDDDSADDRAELQPMSSPEDDWTYRTRQSTEYYEELSSCEENDLQTRKKILRKRIIQEYSDDEVRALDSLARKSNPRCECREALHSGPAACLVGSCTCIKANKSRNENDDDDDDDEDSSREGSTREICCPYCCSLCSSDSKHDLPEKVERKGNPNRAGEAPAATGYDAQQSLRTNANKQNAAEIGNEEPSYEREWLRDDMRLSKPRFERDGANVDCILIYPPQGEAGPPLTLYKGSSNINCRVKGNADTGFRYSVTYVQKFVSPTWIPGAEQAETAEEFECCADHG